MWPTDTVEPRYLELGLSRTPRYLEQNPISLGLAPVFSVIYYGLSRTRLSRTPCYLELFFTSLSSNQPRLSRTLITI